MNGQSIYTKHPNNTRKSGRGLDRSERCKIGVEVYGAGCSARTVGLRAVREIRRHVKCNNDDIPFDSGQCVLKTGFALKRFDRRSFYMHTKSKMLQEVERLRYPASRRRARGGVHGSGGARVELRSGMRNKSCS